VVLERSLSPLYGRSETRGRLAERPHQRPTFNVGVGSTLLGANNLHLSLGVESEGLFLRVHAKTRQKRVGGGGSGSNDC